MMCEDCEGPCSRRTEDEPEQQQPKEYTWNELIYQVDACIKAGYTVFSVDAKSFRDLIKSRPRPPCEECRYQERIDAAERKARKAREDVLNSIINLRKTVSKTCDVQTAWEKEGLHIVYLKQEPIRTTTPQSEQEQSR